MGLVRTATTVKLLTSWSYRLQQQKHGSTPYQQDHGSSPYQQNHSSSPYQGTIAPVHTKEPWLQSIPKQQLRFANNAETSATIILEANSTSVIANRSSWTQGEAKMECKKVHFEASPTCIYTVSTNSYFFIVSTFLQSAPDLLLDVLPDVRFWNTKLPLWFRTGLNL